MPKKSSSLKDFLNHPFKDDRGNQYSQIAADNLVGWWQMGDSNPIDAGPNGISASYENSPPIGTVTLGQKTYGVATFSDSSDRNAVTSANSKLSFSSLGHAGNESIGSDKPFSVSFWVNIDGDGSGVDYFFGKKTNEYGSYYSHTNGTIEFWIATRNGNPYSRITTSDVRSLVEGKFAHIVCVYDAVGNQPASGNGDASQDAWAYENMRVYVNGVNYSQTGDMVGNYTSMRPDHNSPLYIGGSHTNGANEHHGQMSEFAIWSYNLKDSEVKAVYNYTQRDVLDSGFTTQAPRVALKIIDNAENNSFQAKNHGLLSRNLTGRSFIDSKFDDSKSILHTRGTRCEVIRINRAESLLDKVKIFVRGADGISSGSFALSSGDDSLWSSQGGLSSKDIKVDVSKNLRGLDSGQRRNSILISSLVAQSLGEAIQNEKSLKLDVSVKYNEIYLKDQHIDKINISTFGDISPPRAIHHPRAKITITDGDLAVGSAGLSFLDHVIITDGENVSIRYTLVVGSGVPETGTVLQQGSTFATGQTLPSGSPAIGSIAYNINGLTLNGLLRELKKAIEGTTGHNGSIIVGDIPAEQNGAQTVEIMSAVPYKSGESGNSLVISETHGALTVSNSELGSIGRPTSTITVSNGTLPSEGSHITIVTGDGTSRKYLTMIGASTSLETGTVLKADSDTGASTAGGANVGAIGVAMGATYVSYFEELRKAITHPNGHGKKIKVTSTTPTNTSPVILRLEDMTEGAFVPGIGSTIRSVTETSAVASVAVTNWGALSQTKVSGGKIVETVLGDEDKNINVEVLNSHKFSSKVIHGLNTSLDGLSKNALIGHHTAPDITSRLAPSKGSQYNSHLGLITSGTSKPFKEDKIFAAFGGEPGNNFSPNHTYLTRKSEVVSNRSIMGPGYQGQLSSKECITIELDALQLGGLLTLYPAGQGSSNQSRPTMAYLDAKNSTWATLKGDRVADKNFPGNTNSSVSAGIINTLAQVTERAHVGFGQGQNNLFRMIKAPNDNAGSFVLGSFKMSAESLEAEKERFAFIESSHNPCINSFGFPSHPKFYANDDKTINVSDYLDSDFLVENIAIQATIKTPAPEIDPNDMLDKSNSYATRNGSFGEIIPTGCTFFLLNQRKTYLPTGIAQNTFHLETDPAGVVNRVSKNIQREGLSIPGWYPSGERLAWSRGSAPNSIIYGGGADSSVNGGTHANTTGWSFKAFDSDGSTDADFVVDSNKLQLRDNAFITTSVAEDTSYRDDNTARQFDPPYNMPLPEGYSTSSYLTTSEAYRLRLIAQTTWTGSNTKHTYMYIYVYATYIDQLQAADPNGVRNLVARYKFPYSALYNVHDIPLKTVYDGAGRKFNLSISFKTDGSHDDNYLSVAGMEIYRVAESNYVDTIRDVIGWGPVGVFPTEFDDLVGSQLATKAKDPRDSYSLVISDDSENTREVVVSFPAKSPAYGNFGTLQTGEAGAEAAQIITNWDSTGRSGIEGVPSDRSVIRAQSPGVETTYVSRQYNSRFEIPQPKSDSAVSPYLLKKEDKLILGVQSLTSYNIPDAGTEGKSVQLAPSKVTIKLYGSRVSNEVGTFSQTHDILNTNSVHQAIGNDPIRDQFETEPNYSYEGTYLDNIVVGDTKLIEKLRGGQIIDLGIGSAVGTGQVVNSSRSTEHLGKKIPQSFGFYGDFDPFLPTFQSIASPPSTFPLNEKFLVTDQNGLSRIYLSSNAVSSENPSQNGSDTLTVSGVTAPAIRFYYGGSNGFQDGVRELAYAINHSSGHSGGYENSDHIYAVESTFESNVPNKKHVVQLIPRVSSRQEADLYDEGAVGVTIAYDPASTSYWSVVKDARYEHLGGATRKAAGLAMAGIGWQWNWHRRSKDFDRGVVARSARGTAGITGSFQKFVQLKEDGVYKYDSLVMPTYEFLSMFDVYVPWNQSGTSADGSQHNGNAVLALTGAFLPLFQRGQIINQLGGLYTGYSTLQAGEVHQRLDDASNATKGWDKNVLNLWSRWPFERGDRRSIDTLNPTTFKCDVFGSALKKAQDICRVNVPDLGRLDAGRMSSGSNVGNIGAHYSASLVGFGRGNATWQNTAASIDGIATHLRRTPKMQGETEWASYSPRENPDVAKKTLKALYGFETSHFMRWGTAEKYMHRLTNGNDYFYFRSRFRESYAWGMASVDRSEIADSVSRSHIVVRGMRYGIDNYVPTEDKVYMRHNKYGQFRDMLEQRKFYASCGLDGVAFEDRPVQVRFVSRQIFDDSGNVIEDRKFDVDPGSTNSQNLSTYATASIPFMDDWELSSLGNSVWQYGRDRDTVQPDLASSITSIQAS